MTTDDGERRPPTPQHIIRRRYNIYRRWVPDDQAFRLAEFTPLNSPKGAGILRLMPARVEPWREQGYDDEEARDLAYQELEEDILLGEDVPWELRSMDSP